MRKLLLIPLLITGLCVKAQITPNGATVPQLPLPAVPAAYNSNIQVNFVRTWEARQATADTTVPGLNNNSLYKTATAYQDGLGRPLQTVIKGNNYDGTKDIVSMNVYDEFGREAKQYLPYAPSIGSNGKFRVNAFSEQQGYYNTNYQDQTPFSQTQFEASPLNRPLQTNAAGNSWAGSNRGVAIQYAFNKAADSVKIANIDIAPGSLPVFTGLYASNQLFKITTTDEHGKMVVEYKDKAGLVLFKKAQVADNPGTAYTGWLCTYYIYDDLNRLRFAVQPKGMEWLVAHGWNFNNTGGNTVTDELCFKYEYDGDGRMILKKVPGAAEVYLCYDRRNRLVYTQDGSMRQQNKWIVTFYDELNRPLSTALYSTTQTRNQLQAGLDNIITANPVPVIAENLLTRLSYTYYDEYAMPGGANYDASKMNAVQSIVNPGDEIMDVQARNECTRGMVTCTQTRILETSDFIKSTIYYDAKGRPVQTYSTNHRGGTDVSTLVYSYTGKLLACYLAHTNPHAALPATQATSVYTRNVYHNDYLLKTEQNINNTVWVRLAEMEYDDLGNSRLKRMGQPESNFYINMDYNVRGWLTGINRAAQQSIENSNNTIGFYDAVFSEVLHYDYGYSVSSGGGGYFNGNISGIRWANAADRQARSYGYAYDNANRLLRADFSEKTGNNTWSNAVNGVDYSLTGMGYDANGNILNLSQKALKINTSHTIDSLAYQYLPNSNKLMRVTDATPVTSSVGSGPGDFKDGTNTGDDYLYDINGNLNLDLNKNIANIAYNYLNLCREITVPGKGSVLYTYTASGQKLQKTVTEMGKTTITDYIGSFVYQYSHQTGAPAAVQTDTLLFTTHTEGRTRYAKQYFSNGDSVYTWHNDYFYKDHLGSIRAIVTEQRDTGKYMASFETVARPVENVLFANIEETAFPISNINQTGIGSTCLNCEVPAEGTNYPADNTTDPNQFTSRLNGEGKKVGAAITLKVMAGDKVDLAVKAWYPRSAVPGLPEQSAENVLQSLLATLAGNVAELSGGKASQEALQGQQGPLMPCIQSFLNNHPESEDDPSRPRAYINWLLLDEQFRYVPNGSGFIPVPGYSDELTTLATSGLPIAKSGYLFVYVSNETRNRDVFFDNLTVQHYTGPLSETEDYTPWGLQMNMLGSKAFGRVQNKLKYNGKEEQNGEFTDGSGLEWIDYGARMYDHQVGRFFVQDKFQQKYISNSSYGYVINNPVSLMDINGDSLDLNDFKTNPEPGKVTLEDLDIWNAYDGMITSWSNLTGLELTTNEAGQLIYKVDEVTGEPIIRKDKDGKLIGSAIARSALIADIKDPRKVRLLRTKEQRAGWVHKLKRDDIYINYQFAKYAQDFSVSEDLNPETIGIGIVYFHERGHSIFGHKVDDPLPGSTEPSEADDLTNRIRAEMGSNWGQMLTYWPINIGNVGYWPMSQESKTELLNNRIPKKQFIVQGIAKLLK